MRRNIFNTFTVAALLMTAATFFSCISDEQVLDVPVPDSEKLTIRIAVPGNSLPSTRALTTADEYDVTEIAVLAFDADDKQFYGRYPGFVTSGPTGTGGTGSASAEMTFQVTLPVGEFDLMVVANANAMLNAAATADNLDKEDAQATVIEAIQATMNTSGWDVTTPAPLPMWGYKKDVNITETTTSLTDPINLTRMVAKVDIKLGTDLIAADKFELQSVRVYNYSEQGRLVPDIAGANAAVWDGITFSELADLDTPTLPSGYTRAASASEWIDYTIGAGETALERSIYLFEAPAGVSPMSNKAGYLTNTCLVIGGDYNEGGTTYYRIDFAQNNVYLPLMRNHSYSITVTDITADGLDSQDDALKSTPVNIEANIIDWEENGTSVEGSNGIYKLKVSDRVVALPKEAATFPMTITTDYSGGWKAEIWDTETGTGTSVRGWLSLSPASVGSADTPDGTEATLTASANPDATPRPAWIHVTAGVIKLKIEVAQEATPPVATSLAITDSLLFGYDATKARVLTVTADGPWEYNIEGLNGTDVEDKFEITVTGGAAPNYNGKITVKPLTKNYGKDFPSLHAAVTVTATGNDTLEDTGYVSQMYRRYGIPASPGVIGYIHNPGKANHHRLTIGGSVEYKGTPVDNPDTEALFGTAANGYMQDTVHVAYFKFGSLVAVSGELVGLDVAKDATNTTVVAAYTAPMESDDILLTSTTHASSGGTGEIGLRKKYDAATTLSTKWNSFGMTTVLSGASRQYWPADLTDGLGDPCDYYFAQGGYRAGDGDAVGTPDTWHLPSMGPDGNKGWYAEGDYPFGHGTWGGYTDDYFVARSYLGTIGAKPIVANGADGIPVGGYVGGLGKELGIGTSEPDWTMFLPFTGYRSSNTIVSSMKTRGYYWGSTYTSGSDEANTGTSLTISASNAGIREDAYYYNTKAIRCVRNVTPPNTTGFTVTRVDNNDGTTNAALTTLSFPVGSSGGSSAAIFEVETTGDGWWSAYLDGQTFGLNSIFTGRVNNAVNYFNFQVNLTTPQATGYSNSGIGGKFQIYIAPANTSKIPDPKKDLTGTIVLTNWDGSVKHEIKVTWNF